MLSLKEHKTTAHLGITNYKRFDCQIEDEDRRNVFDTDKLGVSLLYIGPDTPVNRELEVAKHSVESVGVYGDCTGEPVRAVTIVVKVTRIGIASQHRHDRRLQEKYTELLLVRTGWMSN